VKRLPIEDKFQVGPFNVVVFNWGKKEDKGEKHLKGFLKNLQVMGKRIQKAGFGKSIQGLLVKVSFDRDDLRSGSYNREMDDLFIHHLGLLGDTFVHEIGHRFYYRILSTRARRYWEEIIKDQTVEVNLDDIKEFVGRYSEAKRKEILKLLGKEKDLIKRAKFSFLQEHFPAFTRDKSEILKFYDKNYKGEEVYLEEISDYARENPVEAFAEVFRLYISKGPRALRSMIKQIFKKVSRSGGAKIVGGIIEEIVLRVTKKG